MRMHRLCARVVNVQAHLTTLVRSEQVLRSMRIGQKAARPDSACAFLRNIRGAASEQQLRKRNHSCDFHAAPRSRVVLGVAVAVDAGPNNASPHNASTSTARRNYSVI